MRLPNITFDRPAGSHSLAAAGQRGDLLHVKPSGRRLMVFTEDSMLEYFKKEVSAGRFPPEIELLHIELPGEIQAKVLTARDVASKETSPSGVGENAL